MGTTLIHDRKSIADQERKKEKSKHRNNKDPVIHAKNNGLSPFSDLLFLVIRHIF